MNDQFFRDWTDWKARQDRNKVKNRLTCEKIKTNKYYDRWLIVDALIFWNFLFWRMPWDESNLTQVEWMRRKDLLEQFINHGNRYIAIIAMIESMPTAVWREILWDYRIPFVTLEEFLYKLTKEQGKAIRNVYDELYDKKIVPHVFSPWYYSISRPTMEKIFLEKYDQGERYREKNVMNQYR